MSDTERKTTKKCPLCGNTKLILLPSLNQKICPSCPNNDKKNYTIDWYLEHGQKKYY